MNKFEIGYGDKTCFYFYRIGTLATHLSKIIAHYVQGGSKITSLGFD